MYDIQSIFDIHIIENVSMGPHLKMLYDGHFRP